MKVSILQEYGTDRDVANAARTTISLEDTSKDVRDSYMHKLYLCEHSPIRIKQFLILVEEVPYWVVMHFVRHKYGIEHWVTTQRDDRTGKDRGKAPQEALVNWKFLVNAQEVLFISRKRLCKQAHRETRQVWVAVLEALKEEGYESLVEACVPDCVYRGWCYEYSSCDFHKTAAFQEKLKDYRKGVN